MLLQLVVYMGLFCSELQKVAWARQDSVASDFDILGLRSMPGTLANKLSELPLGAVIGTRESPP